MQTYSYRHVDWRPGARLKKPLADSKIAVVTSAAFYCSDQQPFDQEMKGGDYSFREIPDHADVQTLMIGHRSEASITQESNGTKTSHFHWNLFGNFRAKGKSEVSRNDTSA